MDIGEFNSFLSIDVVQKSQITVPQFNRTLKESICSCCDKRFENRKIYVDYAYNYSLCKDCVDSIVKKDGYLLGFLSRVDTQELSDSELWKYTVGSKEASGSNYIEKFFLLRKKVEVDYSPIQDFRYRNVNFSKNIEKNNRKLANLIVCYTKHINLSSKILNRRSRDVSRIPSSLYTARSSANGVTSFNPMYLVWSNFHINEWAMFMRIENFSTLIVNVNKISPLFGYVASCYIDSNGVCDISTVCKSGEEFNALCDEYRDSGSTIHFHLWIRNRMNMPIYFGNIFDV